MEINSALEYKRPHSDIYSIKSPTIETNNLIDGFTLVKIKPETKQPKPLTEKPNDNARDDLDNKLLPICNYIDQPNILLNYYQFKSIM